MSTPTQSTSPTTHSTSPPPLRHNLPQSYLLPQPERALPHSSVLASSDRFRDLSLRTWSAEPLFPLRQRNLALLPRPVRTVTHGPTRRFSSFYDYNLSPTTPICHNLYNYLTHPSCFLSFPVSPLPTCYSHLAGRIVPLYECVY